MKDVRLKEDAITLVASDGADQLAAAVAHR